MQAAMVFASSGWSRILVVVDEIAEIEKDYGMERHDIA